MAIISLGNIDKKLLYPVIYIIIYALIHIYRIYNKGNIVTITIENTGVALGLISTIFINYAFKPKFQKENKEKKNYFKNYFFLVLINILYALSDLFGTILGEDEDGNNIYKLYVNDSIEIIVLSIITYFFLKYKYYLHHIISIVAIVIFAIVIDIILDNYPHTSTFIWLNSILFVTADSFIFIYYKYLIDFKYYYFMDVIFAEGLIHLGMVIASFFLLLLFQSLNDSKTIVSEFIDYYEEFGIGKMILCFFLYYIFRGFSAGFLNFLIVKELTPNYVIIAYEIAKIPASIIENEGANRWFILILTLFQIVFLLFYLEILEYNFCSLNKNTKRNIRDRERIQKSIDEEDISNGRDSEIIIKGYDVSKGFQNQDESMIELVEGKKEDNENEDN